MTLLGQRSFSDLGTPLSDVAFCVLDLETTGVAPDTCEITEIGAIRYEGGVEVGRFDTLVNPRSAIPPTVTVMTGITQAMVIDAPLIEEALPSLLEFIGDAVIVGHNVRFDISFLNAASLRLGYGRLTNPSVDTLRLARRLLGTEVRSLKLSRLAAHLGSPVTPNHRAFADAHATAHVLWALLERAGAIGVTHLDDLLALPTIKGARAIDKLSRTEHLPRTPGVYLFVDRNDTVIYVGKATNLRARVRSYFAGDHRRQIDALLRDMARIDHRTTTGELEASVIELRLIDDLVPRYNRRSRPPRALHWLTLTDERFPRLSITRTPGRGRAQIGPFRSRRSAEAAMHALWDASMIRRCTSRGRGCHAAQLGVCVCPHEGTMSEAEYDAIVEALMIGLRTDPTHLFAAVMARLRTLVATGRFEDAAACRDNWRALASALDRTRIWRALQSAGTIIARNGDALVSVTRGTMTGSWRIGTTQPLPAPAPAPADFPSSMLAADEASLVWKWLMHPDTEVVGVSGELALPPAPIPRLEHLDQATDEPGCTSVSGASSTTPSSVRAPMTRTSERNPPIRIGSRPLTTTT
jgi:DNA polymerase-3 subunit epsilon